MRIYSNRAENFISSIKAGAVLIYGEDIGEVIEIERRIIKNFVPNTTDMDIVQLPMEKIKENSAVLLEEVNSRIFFSSKKIIRIADAADSLTKHLDLALSQISQDTVIIITASELEKKSSLRKFFEDSQSLTAIACYKEDQESVKRYIGNKLSAAGIRAEIDALEYMSANLGENKMITNNEVEKIITFCAAEKVFALEDAVALLASNSDINLINLAFLVTAKDRSGFEKGLANVFAEQESGVGILRVMIWHFQRLAEARAMFDKGVPPEQAAKALRPPVFFKQTAAFCKAVTMWNKEKIQKALDRLNKAELETKIAKIDPELICHRILLSLVA